MRLRGVQVLSTSGDFAVQPTVTSDIEAISDADVVILGTKAYSPPDLAPVIGAYLPSHAVVVPAQNGVRWWLFQMAETSPN